MSTLLVATLAWTTALAADAPRTAAELRAAVRTSLAAEALADDPNKRLRAVADLVRVYGEMRTNENLAYRDRVHLRAKIRSRLGRVAADLERQLGADRPEKTVRGSDRADDKADEQTTGDPGRRLLQLIENTLRPPAEYTPGGPGGVAGGGPGTAAVGGHAMAGAGGSGGGIHGGGFGNAKAEQAEALIELIRTTIRPESWDVNGGRGTIMYWPGS